jgi:GntR family transcriptional regulator, vanillate catabolism transcriptional regulator
MSAAKRMSAAQPRDPILTSWDPSRTVIEVSDTLSQAVVRIREMILRAEFAPGQRVAEAPLAEMLRMSRTPIRQALPLLAQEGLLMEHPTRGFVVRPFTAADIADAIDLRAVLEGLAVRRIAERGAPKSLLRDLRACLEDGDAIFDDRRLDENDEATYAEMNSRFHTLIVQAADSPILSEAIERNSRIPFAGAHALAFDDSKRDPVHDILSYAHRQHRSIVDALEHGHGARAEALMREHAYLAKESINVAGFTLTF